MNRLTGITLAFLAAASPMCAEGQSDVLSAQAEVKRALQVARGQRTVVVVAHRYSMVEGADRVIVLETGCVTQTGTVEELRSGAGWFARFARRAAQAEA